MESRNRVLKNLKGDFNSSNAFYYAIFPSTKTDFEFSYFNKDTKKWKIWALSLKSAMMR